MKKYIIIFILLLSSLTFAQEKEYMFEDRVNELKQRLENIISVPRGVENTRLTEAQNLAAYKLNGEKLRVKDSTITEYKGLSEFEVRYTSDAFYSKDQERVLIDDDRIPSDLKITLGKILPEIILFTLLGFFIFWAYSEFKNGDNWKNERWYVILLLILIIFFTYIDVKDTNLEIGMISTIIGLIIGIAIFFSTRVKNEEKDNIEN